MREDELDITDICPIAPRSFAGGSATQKVILPGLLCGGDSVNGRCSKGTLENDFRAGVELHQLAPTERFKARKRQVETQVCIGIYDLRSNPLQTSVFKPFQEHCYCTFCMCCVCC